MSGADNVVRGAFAMRVVVVICGFGTLL